MASLVRLFDRAWWVVIAAWLVLTVVLVNVAPSFDEVATFDDSTFLPEGSPALVGNALLEEGWPDDDLTNAMTIVIERPDGPLTDADTDHLADLATWLRSDDAPEVIGAVTTHLDDPQLADQLVAEDGRAAFLLAGLEVRAYTPRANTAVQTVRDHVEATPPADGADIHVTGAAAVAADENLAIERTVSRTTWLTLALVALILLWVYRSPIAPLVPLVTIGVAFVTGRAVVSLLAQAGMQVASMYETFAIVIVFGAGTDYCLFLLSRYHEELQAGERAGFRPGRRLRVGTLTATSVVMLAVLGSSAATTIVGFSAQGVARFGLYRTMGPALAVSIAVTVVTALTLAPALMRLAGRWLFWPDRWSSRLATGTDEVPLVVQRGAQLGLLGPDDPAVAAEADREHEEVAP